MTPKFLVFELHHFGDAVMAFPFLNAAARRGSVTVFCTPPVAKMLDALLPTVKTIAARATWAGRYWQACTQLRKLRPTVAVSAWSDSRVQILGWLCGAPVRAGLPMNEKNYYATHSISRRLRLLLGHAIESVASSLQFRLLTTAVTRPTAHAPHAQNWSLLGDTLDVSLDLSPPWLDAQNFFLPAAIEHFLSKQHAAGRPICVIHPGGRLPAKRWPKECFQQLLDGYFLKNEIATVIIHEPDEEAPRPTGDHQQVFTCTSHENLAAILDAADFVLTNDSYPAHLSAALGKKTFAIFGSGDPAIFAPHGNASRVIQGSGCPRHQGPHRSLTPCSACLATVTVNHVETRLAQR